MTDKEIALELGTRLIKAKLRVAAMSGELEHYRDAQWNRVPWRNHVKEILDSLEYVAQERVERLTDALDAATPEDLLHALHSFLEELKT